VQRRGPVGGASIDGGALIEQLADGDSIAALGRGDQRRRAERCGGDVAGHERRQHDGNHA
jgi:hypothetical protein